MRKIYYEELDMLKGIAILGVIFLHGRMVEPVNICEGLGIFGDIIASFPLYLFFVISGFFFFPSATSNWKDFLYKKSKRLLLPYLFFNIVFIVLDCVKKVTIGDVYNFIIQVFNSVIYGKHIWFLYSLFLILCLNKLLGRYKLGGAFLLLLVDYFSLVTINIRPFDLAIHYNIFFCIGILISKHYDGIKQNIIEKSKQCISISFVLFLLIGTLYVTRAYHIREFAIYLLPLFESVFIWLIVYIFKVKNKGFLIHFGHYSLQYYCNHGPIMALGYLFVPVVYRYTHSFVLSYIVLLSYTILLSWFVLIVEIRLRKLHLLFGL